MTRDVLGSDRSWVRRKEILRVQGNCSCNGYTLLHAAADFTREFIFGFDEVHTLQTEHGAAGPVAQGVRTEHVERKHYVVQHSH